MPATTTKVFLSLAECQEIRELAYYAPRYYGRPVGDIICRELLFWEDLGYYLSSDLLYQQLVEQVRKVRRNG